GGAGVQGTRRAGTGVVSAESVTRAQVLRQLELAVTRRLDGLLHGDHRGLVPGAGTEPGEGREYRSGDDVRRMDWNLTARTGVAHVRETIADRELETWIVVDQSASLNFGTAACEKRDLALAAAASFAFLTARAGNRVGAVTLGPDGPAVLPARTGRDAALALLHRLDAAPRTADRAGPASDPAGDLARTLAVADRAARRRGLVAVVSDFLDRSAWPARLRGLGVRHQVIAVEVRDPREDDLPPVGYLTLVDPETGRRLEVQTQKGSLRRRFAEAAVAQREAVRAHIVGAGAAHLVLSTDRDWLGDLVRFVEAGRKRR
ncbi:MAG: DUF58 domain-containing protein, partial [Acidimicrobiia bacterium]